MPSAEIVEVKAFEECEGLIDAKFGSKLEEIERLAFDKCRSLERITIPLKQIITRDNIFTWCKKLRHIDLVEDVILRKTVDALNVEDWRNDMNEEIHSINQILPNAPAGYGYDDAGWKAHAIQSKASTRVVNEAASSLQLSLPQDLVMNNAFSFLVALPSHTFEREEEEENSDDESDY
eukprot:scaffold14319_cov148-Skeletonema_menzelii.AAC.6